MAGYGGSRRNRGEPSAKNQMREQRDYSWHGTANGRHAPSYGHPSDHLQLRFDNNGRAAQSRYRQRAIVPHDATRLSNGRSRRWNTGTIRKLYRRCGPLMWPIHQTYGAGHPHLRLLIRAPQLRRMTTREYVQSTTGFVRCMACHL